MCVEIMLNIGKIRKIHFIGIGGIGMSGMAELLVKSGYVITGSDIKKNDRTDFLSSIGLNISIGHDKKNIKEVDLVVYSSAISLDNIEIVAANKSEVPIIRRAEMLAELVRLKPLSIGVSGTHGKTTTCSLIGSILHYAEKSPTLAIGGIVKSFGTNAVSGKGDIIVVEADEYDRTFLSLSPVISIINNIEEEHLDCYNDFNDLKKAFKQFMNNIPFYGFSMVNVDDVNVSSLIRSSKRPIVKYGINNKENYHAKDICFNGSRSSYSFYEGVNKIADIDLSIPGKHNIYNSLCAAGLCLELGIDIAVIVKALKEFKGIKRRFDIRYKDSCNIYIDDYAHHPTEIKATIDSAKGGWADRDVVAIFQPHLYSRTQAFYKDFAQALYGADTIILMNIYGAREKEIDGVSSNLISDELIKIGHKNCMIASKDDLLEKLEGIYSSKQIFITMGAGDLYMKADEIINWLSK